MFPGWKLASRDGFWLESVRQSFKIGHPEGRRPLRKAGFEALLDRIKPKSGPENQFPTRTHY
jgi:hypothetical protein